MGPTSAARIPFQILRGIGYHEQQGGVIVAMLPCIFDGKSRLADPAEAMQCLAHNRRRLPVGGAEQAAAQLCHEVIATFEQRAQARIRQGDRFRGLAAGLDQEIEDRRAKDPAGKLVHIGKSDLWVTAEGL